MNLDKLFKPRNIVMFYASPKLYYFIEGFKAQNYDRDNLFLISPTHDKLFDIKCYSSIDEVPSERIDLCILAVRREMIIKSLNEVLSKKEISFIHFFSAGAGEADDIGLEIERKIQEILSKRNNTRAIGPNCMGVYCPSGKNAYSPTFPLENGNIGLIFHSGDLHSKMIIYSYYRYKLTFSKGVSVGNCVDLQIADFLEYYNQDDETEIICVYFEGIPQSNNTEGKNLLKVLKKMTKPVLFLRGGRTRRAQTAVQTHTGSLGTSKKMWDAIYKQTNTIESGQILDDLIDNTYLFSEFFKKYKNITPEEQIKYYPKRRNALVILWSGGLGILDTDALTELGINLPLFEGKGREKLMEAYPLKIGSLSNPLDLPWIAGSEHFTNISKAAVSEDIDIVFLETDAPLHWNMERSKGYWENLAQIKDYVNSLNKIFILILPQWEHRNRRKFYKMLLEQGFIVYPSVIRAAKAFLALHEYGKKLRKKND